MGTIIFELLTNFWILLTSIAIYILIGVFLAGVFKCFLPDALIKKHLGGKRFVANIKAAIIGIPLPLCSCSIIPFVSALKKSGASNSAIQTFLISTPITGADSILATYGVMGWVFAIYRTISSVFISLLAGLLSLVFIKEDSINQTLDIQTSSRPCCSSSTVCSAEVSDNITHNNGKTTSALIRRIITYAFDDIFKDIAQSLIIGIVLGALIMTLMPENLSQYLSNNLVLNYLLILLIAMPLYVCATASVPLGVALLSSGFSPGAVFIFLTAGPATNAITMSVVNQVLGKNSLFVYLFSILAGSLFFALIFDWYLAALLNDINSLAAEEHEIIGLFDHIAGILMLILSFKYIWMKNRAVTSTSCEGSCDCKE
jgi:uncharacterized membrane protein YraQ (UPF0718 family)